MNFSSKIYIDGGDPAETRAADTILKKAGHHGLDGQTTNPSLIAKNLSGKQGGKKISMDEAFAEYKKIVREMSTIIPGGKISIQVIGDPGELSVADILSQARDRITWIPNAIIKMPCTTRGLTALEQFCTEGPVNVTLNFSQEQAAAVYAATLRRGISPQGKPYDFFISPFVGRLDDKGQNGMDIVANVLGMYRSSGDRHVKVISASIRNMKHLLYSLFLRCDIITIPFKIFQEWAAGGFVLPDAEYMYDVPQLSDIPYRQMTLDKPWQEYNIRHDLTDAGVAKFWEDWKSIVQ
jgi:transaldolase